MAEHRLCSIAHECQLCQDMEDAYQQCSNKDCEVYYARFKQIIELARCRQKLEEFSRIQWVQKTE